ncbi:MAG: GAF and ANTAR domain-containing protein [Acidimicrobiia bacterium]
MVGFPDAFTDLLLSLNQLMVNEESLDDTLGRVVYLACKSPIGANTAGITLQSEGGPTSTAYYGDGALPLDRAQYATDDGPCLTAYRTGETVRLDHIATESGRWPDFATQAAQHGIHSSLSLPLVVNGQIMGALNLYGTSPAPFSDDNVDLAGTFARQAAVAIANAEVYWRTYALTQNLEAALDNRDRIGQAKGILIATYRITSDDAFDLLRRASQNLNLKLRDVADHVIHTGELPDDANI